MKVNNGKSTVAASPRVFFLQLVLSIILVLSSSLPLTSATHKHSSSKPDRYVEDACSVTRYIDVCLRSLSPFSNMARRSPSKWARAGVSVTVRELNSVAQLLKSYRISGSRDVIPTCVETIQDALDHLHQSLDVMRRLNRGEFDEQMNDVLTWMSAALTDEGTCADELDGVKGRTAADLRRKVTEASCFTSNALALVNKLATTGLEEIHITEGNG